MWLFRLPWKVYAGFVPVWIGFGLLVYFQIVDDDAARRRALSHQAPAEIAIEKLDPVSINSDYKEVVVVGQIDLANMVELSKTKDGNTKSRRIFAPILSTEEKDGSAPAMAVLSINGSPTDAELARFVVKRGVIGPVMRFDGVLSDDFTLKNDAREALHRSGKVSGDPIIIDAFLEGRNVALAPDGGASGALIAGIVLGILTGMYAWWRRRVYLGQLSEYDAGRYAP